MARLDIVTDGDSRFDLTVGGKSWFDKCVAINLGANIVRRELKLPEVEIPAADPRWTFAG